MWQTAFNYFEDSKIIRDALIALEKCNQENKWDRGNINDHLSIINSHGIGLWTSYGYFLVATQIIDENKSIFLNRQSKEWKRLKEEGLFRLSIFIEYCVTKPDYPAICLKRLLSVLKSEFGEYKIEGKTIYVVQTNSSENIVESYIKLCGIIYKERIKCHNDIKKYLYEKGIIKEYKLMDKDMVQMYGFEIPTEEYKKMWLRRK